MLSVRIAIPALVVAAMAAIAVVQSVPAHAQSINVLDQIVSQFQSRSAGWENTLRVFALGTFGILAAIELAWAAFKFAFRGRI